MITWSANPHAIIAGRPVRLPRAARSRRPGPFLGPTRPQAPLIHAFSNLCLFFTFFALLHLGMHDRAHRGSLANFEGRMRRVACFCDVQRGRCCVSSRRRAACEFNRAAAIEATATRFQPTTEIASARRRAEKARSAVLWVAWPVASLFNK